MIEDDCWLMFPGLSMSDVVPWIQMWTSWRVSATSRILEPLTQEQEVILNYEKWLKDKEEASKPGIMMDSMTKLHVWDSGDTSIAPGVYPVADVYAGHNEVVLEEVRLYLGAEGYFPGPVVLAYKDVQGLIGLGLAGYS